MMLVDRIDNIPQGLFHGSAGTCLVAGLSDTGRAGEAVRGLVEGLKTVQHDLSIASGMPGVAIAADVLARYVFGQGLAGVLADVDAPMYRVYGNGDFPKDYSRLADGVVYMSYRLSYGAFAPTERGIWLRALGMLAEALTEHMRHDADEAFRAAHTMKGMCQNMAFTRLYQSSHAITEILRGKDMDGAKQMLDTVTEDYNIVIAGIEKLLA